MKSKVVMLVLAIAIVLSADALFLILGCSMNNEVEYVCKVMEWDVWDSRYEWTRNTWVMATSEEEAINKCSKKISGGGYCSDCWQN